MATNTTASVPAFYRIFFKYVDPVIALFGVYLNFIDQDAAVKGMAPNSTYDPNTVFLFHQCGGLALAVSFLSAALPRYSDDLTVWKIFQFAIFLSDIAGVSGIYNAMARQGRLAPENWTSDDISTGGVYVLLTILRFLFVVEFGFKRGTTAKRNA